MSDSNDKKEMTQVYADPPNIIGKGVLDRLADHVFVIIEGDKDRVDANETDALRAIIRNLIGNEKYCTQLTGKIASAILDPLVRYAQENHPKEPVN